MKEEEFTSSQINTAHNKIQSNFEGQLLHARPNEQGGVVFEIGQNQDDYFISQWQQVAIGSLTVVAEQYEGRSPVPTFLHDVARRFGSA